MNSNTIGNILLIIVSLREYIWKYLSIGTFIVNIIDRLESDGTKAIAKWLKASSIEWIDLSIVIIIVGYCHISLDAMDELVSAANDCETLKAICISIFL